MSNIFNKFVMWVDFLRWGKFRVRRDCTINTIMVKSIIMIDCRKRSLFNGWNKFDFLCFVDSVFLCNVFEDWTGFQNCYDLMLTWDRVAWIFQAQIGQAWPNSKFPIGRGILLCRLSIWHYIYTRVCYYMWHSVFQN